MADFATTHKGNQNTASVIMRHPRGRRWLTFSAPVEILCTEDCAEVLPLLETVEQRVHADGLWAAGFVSYGASPAFDAAFPGEDPGVLPKLWFALFASCRMTRFATAEGSGQAPAGFKFVRSGQTQPFRGKEGGNWMSTLDQKAYGRNIEAIREYIRSGDTYQINFTHRLRASCDVSPRELFDAMIGAQPPPYATYIETSDWAVCSASPELFFEQRHGRVRSCPMKGTAPRGRWYEEDLKQAENLQKSAKNRAENVMITDMVRNDLSRLGGGACVETSTLCALERHRTVWQLTSTVETASRASVREVFRALFPAASITGAPKLRSMQIIKELESCPRGLYTGALGLMAPKHRSWFSVAIRTAVVDRSSGTAEYGVGGGIVWDSGPASEWRECQDKARILTHSVPSFDLLETFLWTPEGGLSLLNEHLSRLAHSAAYFGFLFNQRRIERELGRKVSLLASGAHKVRLLLSSGGHVSLEAVPLEEDALEFHAPVLALSPVDSTDPFLFHKTTNRAVYLNAQKACPSARDVLLFNEKGQMTETTVANVAFEMEGQLCTPPVCCGLLPGTMRASLLRQGRLVERVVTLQDIRDRPSMFLMNAVRGLQRVGCPDL